MASCAFSRFVPPLLRTARIKPRARCAAHLGNLSPLCLPSSCLHLACAAPHSLARA